jgi:hypothetical protein
LSLTSASVTVVPKQSQLFHPMGGDWANSAEQGGTNPAKKATNNTVRLRHFIAQLSFVFPSSFSGCCW